MTAGAAAARVPAPARRREARRLLIAWIVAKVVVLGLWVVIAPSVQGDVLYYARQLQQADELGPQHALIEYPTPMLWVLRIPALLGTGELPYACLFIAGMIALDAWFTWTLWRRSRDVPARRPWAPWWWVAFTFLLGPTAYLRFDLLPAVLAGMSLLLLAGRRPRPGVAGALVALGASFKLWPALLFPALLGRRDHRRRASLGFVGTGVALVLASLAYAGWNRLLSPLTWQSARGLQVESVWASVPMLERLWRWDLHIYLSQHNAFEIIDARGTTLAWQRVADVATLVGLALIVAAYAGWFVSLRHRRPDLPTAGALMLLVTAIMIVTNKTFSPQYVMWLGGPLAAMLTMTPGDGGWRARPLRHLAYALLALTALTQLVYPIGYHAIIHDTPVTALFTVVLVLRNALALGLVGWLAWLLGRRFLEGARA